MYKRQVITFPELAIFIGLPFLLVNVVVKDIPRALHTEAITSCELYGSVSTRVPSELVSPMAMPPFIPAPPTTTLQLRAQWSRPAFWLTDEPNWPVNGEIDILEGVNDQTLAKTALHSTMDCQMDDVPLGCLLYTSPSPRD